MSINQVIHKNIEPGVINNEIIMKALLEQGPQGESGRLYREDNIVFEEVTSIRLEFLNILKIDHVWMFTSLTKLNLSNNKIEEIENLDMLVNLKELNLSFNYITRIQNLDTLINIEVLSLYKNDIDVLENLDAMKKLTILSIGNNDIEEVEKSILYLRQFPQLRSLNMAENPCSRVENFRIYLSTFLPNLKYYEYRLIRPEEREKGMILYGRTLEKLLEKEADEKLEEDAQAAEEADHVFYTTCYVEYLNGHQFFLSLFEHDPEGQALLKIGEAVQDIYKEYQTAMFQITQQLFKFGQKQHHIREEESKQFYRCIQETKEKNQIESQDATQHFLQERDRIFNKMKLLIKTFDETPEIRRSDFAQVVQENNDEFKKLVENTWTILMEVEQILFEGVDEANTTFGHNMEEMVNIFIEGAQGHFVHAREAEVNYSAQVSEIALNYLTQIESQGPDPDMPEDLRQIMVEKDAVMNAIAGSHDVHMQTIDAREDRLVQRIRDWLNTLKETLKREEVARDRIKVLEINHFLDIQREDFEALHSHFKLGLPMEEVVVDTVDKSNTQQNM